MISTRVKQWLVRCWLGRDLQEGETFWSATNSVIRTLSTTRNERWWDKSWSWRSFLLHLAVGNMVFFGSSFVLLRVYAMAPSETRWICFATLPAACLFAYCLLAFFWPRFLKRRNESAESAESTLDSLQNYPK